MARGILHADIDEIRGLSRRLADQADVVAQLPFAQPGTSGLVGWAVESHVSRIADELRHLDQTTARRIGDMADAAKSNADTYESVDSDAEGTFRALSGTR